MGIFKKIKRILTGPPDEVKWNCQCCSHTVVAFVDDIGKQSTCPRCKRTITVPDPNESNNNPQARGPRSVPRVPIRQADSTLQVSRKEVSVTYNGEIFSVFELNTIGIFN